MKTLILGTAFTLAIASIGSAAYAKEPVPANGTTGESANQRLEVIQQHNRNREQPSLQSPNSNNSQTNSLEQRSITVSTRATCLFKPVTAGAMAQRAFAELQACERAR